MDARSRIGILGANGAGKTTLLRTMTGELVPLAGDASLNRGARVVSFAQHHVESLDLEKSALEHLLARFPGTKELEARGRLAGFGLTEGGAFRKMRTLSGGQKSRVAFCELAWEPPTLVVLDEPTNHRAQRRPRPRARVSPRCDGGFGPVALIGLSSCRDASLPACLPPSPRSQSTSRRSTC